MNARTYRFCWNDKTKFIEASTYSEVRRKFQERFGFWPNPETVEITLLPL